MISNLSPNQENDDEEEDDDWVPYEVILENFDSVDMHDSDGRFFAINIQSYSFIPLRNGGIRGRGNSQESRLH